MQNATFGASLKAARKLRKWSQAKLASETGIIQPRISKLERDLFPPTRREQQSLSRVLGLPTRLTSRPAPLPLADEAWRARPPHFSWVGKRSADARIFAAKKSFGPIVDQHLSVVLKRPDAELSKQFLNQACSDSGLECFLFIKLQAQGGEARSFAPGAAGFRQHPVIDPESLTVINDVRRPCLQLTYGDWQWLFFPQVMVSTPKARYALDALVCAKRNGSPTRYWIDLEADGQGHNSQFDVERERRLGLLTIRLLPEDLASPDVMFGIQQKLESLIDASPTTGTSQA